LFVVSAGQGLGPHCPGGIPPIGYCSRHEPCAFGPCVPYPGVPYGICCPFFGWRKCVFFVLWNIQDFVNWYFDSINRKRCINLRIWSFNSHSFYNIIFSRFSHASKTYSWKKFSYYCNNNRYLYTVFKWIRRFFLTTVYCYVWN